LTKFDAVELRHETVTHCFCGNPRLVGNEEYGSFNHGNLTSIGAFAVKCFTYTSVGQAVHHEALHHSV
jgi:hypothetical protein